MQILLMMLLSIFLMACSPKEVVVKTEVIKCNVSDPPAALVYHPVTWTLVGSQYCLTEDNGKALFINIRMMNAREAELEAIIRGAKGIEK